MTYDHSARAPTLAFLFGDGLKVLIRAATTPR
jgi:hypothetical protein